MIRVVKPTNAPASLAGGVSLTAANCAAYDADPSAYRSGSKRFSFLKKVYGPDAVKNALKRAQHHKCCFCEARFAANYAGDVEHYRPKGAIKQPSQKILPGYYWLAYEWGNLYYACADCNQYRKRDQFPITDENVRARDHHDALGAEAPLLLDPGGGADPRNHIKFKDDIPIWLSEVGRITIRTLKLDREELNLARRSHLATLADLRTLIELLAGDPRPEAIDAVKEARLKLSKSQKPDAVFSAAAQDFIAKKPK